ncbi:MAG: phosphate--AMP phosphotransferase, partial [Methanomicrobiales archaeon]
MFEKLDLNKTINDETFEKPIDELKERLSILQRTLRDLNIPVIIVLEGWNASGITMSIQEIIQSLDPRGFNLHAIENPTDLEKTRPFMWRFWLKIPSNGRITIFARSWYSRALAEKLSIAGWKKSMKNEITSINNFERNLSDNGTTIIKFFLHISKEDQKMRLLVRERNPLTAWLVTPKIWNFHHHYDTYLPIIEDFIENTDMSYAPWHVIWATDREDTILKIYSVLVKTLQKKIADTHVSHPNKNKNRSIVKLPKKQVMRRASSESTHTKKECQDILNNLQIEMLELHYLLFKRKIPFVIAYEGWDAAGKGGN